MTGKKWRWIALFAFGVTVLFALRLIGPAVPDEIRMLTGPEGTTFYEYGLRYKELLAGHGVTVHVERTTGSLENVAKLLEADMPTTAFLEAIRDPADRDREAPEGIESLGTMYLQPVWVFVKKDANLNTLEELKGSRIAAGEKTSDSRMLMVFMLQAEGIDDDVEFVPGNPMTPEGTARAVQDRQVVAIVASGEPDSELIDTLLRTPTLRAMSIRRADAFAIKFPFLRPVGFPEGAHDLEDNIPDEDLQLLAARARLAVATPFPPGLADLLLQAATEIHGGRTPFSARGEFPDPESATLPLSRAAANFYENGPSKLQKFLPFRLATWLNRFFTAVVAIASAAVAIFKIIPALASLPFKMRVMGAYRALEEIERSASAGTDKKTLLEELEKQDQATAAIKIPLRSLKLEWFELRQYIHDMRDRLEAS